MLEAFAIRVLPPEMVEMEPDDDQELCDGFPAIFWAAVAWIVDLNLPADERELWDGSPIVER